VTLTAAGARSPIRCKKLLFIVSGFLAWACALLLAASPAQAAKIGFGTNERIVKIQDTGIKGPQGEELFLAHKISHHSFVLPYMATDDGYVLGVKGKSSSYYRLDDTQIKDLQARGLLPSPLPPYELSALDLAAGYLLWGVLALLAISGVLALFAKKRQTRALPQLNYAIERHRAGELDLAIENYTLAVQIDRKLAPAFNLRGNAYEAKGEDGKAVTDYTMAITLEPKALKPLLDRGMLMERKGQFDLAIADFSRVIKLAKKEPAAYCQRGRIYFRKGDFDRTIADCTKAIKIAPEFADAYRLRSMAYTKKGQDELARADQAKANLLVGDRAPPVPA
jgi:tetratricopeptide (TPR) repeat protein